MKNPLLFEVPSLPNQLLGHDDVMEVQCPDEAKFRYLPSEAADIILAGAQIVGVTVPEEVETIAVAACLQMPHRMVIAAAKATAEVSVGTSEKELKRRGYTDEEWLT